MKISKEFIVLLASCILLPILGSVVSVLWLKEWHFDNIAVHAVTELIGSVIAVFICFFLFYSTSLRSIFKPHEISWVATAIIGMGILDGFHAFAPIGNNFVWLHSIATVTGGVLFAGVLLPNTNPSLLKKLPIVSLVLATTIGVASHLYPEAIPAMLHQETFTVIARFLNIIGGIGFIAATWYFFKQYQKSHNRPYYILAGHCLLFGVAAVLFELSALWDAAWWWWHALRLIAYSILIYFLLRNTIYLLRNKIIALVACVTCATAFILGGANFLRTMDISLNTAIEGLANETRLSVMKFKDAYDEMENDIQIVSFTPPIEGIIRSHKNYHIDPIDGSSTELWRKRLETIFRSIMSARPHYTQMRYIGVADGGREIVRVNRMGNGLIDVPVEKLQQKENEPYFAAGKVTKPGQVYFSKVTYNREHNQLDAALTPTLRTVWPIYTINNTLFGMLVINADYEKLLKYQLSQMQLSHNTFVVNEHGDYMEYKDGTIYPLEFHRNFTKDAPEFIDKIIHSDKDEAAYIDGNYVDYFVRLQIDSNNSDSFLGIIRRIKRQDLLASTYAAGKESLLLSFGLLMVAVFISLYLGRKFTQPLRKIAVYVNELGQTDSLDTLINNKDEVGELARAFKWITDNLTESESRHRAILDSTIDGVITINDKGIIESYNTACETIFGYCADDVIGKNINMLMPEPYHQQHDDYLAHYRKTGEKKIIGIGRELEGKKKDGTVFPIDLSISETIISGNKLFTGITRDITERKKWEEEIKSANKELETFTYIASHDLRSPLINLKGYSMQIEKHMNTLAPVITNALDTLPDNEREEIQKIIEKSIPDAIGFIDSGVSRIDSMTNAILQLSRNGKQDFHYETIDLNRIVDTCVKSIHHQLSQQNTQVSIGELPTLYADRLSIEQIFSNLLDNAVKYLSSDRDGHIEIKAEESDAYYTFSIEDNGRGIAQKDFEKVFAIFRRAKSAIGTEGEGMGLNYVKSLVKRYQGDIWFESELDKGTCFYFTISKHSSQPEHIMENYDSTKTL